MFIIAFTKSDMLTPAALAAFGTRLVAVIPGAVFSSRIYAFPSAVSLKSALLYALQPNAS